MLELSCAPKSPLHLSAPPAFPPLVFSADKARRQVVIGFWEDSIHVGVWIAIILLVIIALNSFVVGGYGEAEFIFSSECAWPLRCLLQLLI